MDTGVDHVWFCEKICFFLSVRSNLLVLHDDSWCGLIERFHRIPSFLSCRLSLWTGRTDISCACTHGAEKLMRDRSFISCTFLEVCSWYKVTSHHGRYTVARKKNCAFIVNKLLKFSERNVLVWPTSRFSVWVVVKKGLKLHWHFIHQITCRSFF